METWRCMIADINITEERETFLFAPLLKVAECGADFLMLSNNKRFPSESEGLKCCLALRDRKETGGRAPLLCILLSIKLRGSMQCCALRL